MMDDLYSLQESANRLCRLLEEHSMQLKELRARVEQLELRRGDDYLERCFHQ